MRSEITRGGKSVRPSFNYVQYDDATPTAEATCQMLGSLRNLQESYNADFLCALGEIAATLKRIDRRLATKIKIRGHK